MSLVTFYNRDISISNVHSPVLKAVIVAVER